ncbi:TolC family protein [Fibrobacter sp. UWP2]|uniref:TolC family protein n=1 Tax=Fibrobacter sp. UWP2 TaxID=1896216 RepID=UPI000920DAA7|nr:TolC family protein [Fibrobacter sp. UWP2]SHI54070.1 outer membrane protein [Fibrobacter sp. UWP2]
MNTSKAIIFGLLAWTPLVFADGAWTLDACLAQAKQKSLQLESAKLREQQADIQIRQAKSSRYPSVNASIQNTLYDHPFIDTEDHYRLNLGVSGSYTLWDGGSTSLSVEANQLSKQAAQLETKQTERSIQESVLNAYMSLLAAGENLRTANASVELAQAEFEHYGKLFEAGSITKKDLTQSQSNVLQKQVAQLTAQLNVNTSKTTLRQLLELPETEDFAIEAPETNITSPDSLESIPALAELQKSVREAHPGLKSDSVSVRAAKKSTEVAGAGNSISVTLGANSSTGLQAWESKAYKNQLKYGWQNSVSLAINIPIIDGGATENKVLLAQVNESATQVSMQETAKSLENSIEKLYLNAVSADMQWKAAILQVEAEQEALLVAEEQRNAGALTYTDYLGQKNNLETAQVNLVNAKYTSLLARKVLDLYQGKLD